MTRRGNGGRFTKAAPDDDGLAPMVDLTIEPIDIPEPAEPYGPTITPETSGLEPAAEIDTDTPLALALAHGIDELVGLLAGAQYKAAEEEVQAVGEAAAPVLRRVLEFVHAGELAESNVPAPLREITTLALRVYVAWGDGLVIFARQQLEELRERRDGTADRSARAADNGGSGTGGPNRLSDDHPAEVAAARGAGQEVPAPGRADGAPTAYELAARNDTGARPRRPGQK